MSDKLNHAARLASGLIAYGQRHGITLKPTSTAGKAMLPLLAIRRAGF